MEPVPRADALGRGRQLPARRDPALLRRRGGDARRLRPLRRLPPARRRRGERRGDEPARAQGALGRRAHPRPLRPHRRGRSCSPACPIRASQRAGLDRTPTFGALASTPSRGSRSCCAAASPRAGSTSRPASAGRAAHGRGPRGDAGRAAGAAAAAARARGRGGAARRARVGAAPRAAPRPAEAPDALPAEAASLFEALRAAALELARAESVPPYVVASDRTLRDIARCARAALEMLSSPTASARPRPSATARGSWPSSRRPRRRREPASRLRLEFPSTASWRERVLHHRLLALTARDEVGPSEGGP